MLSAVATPLRVPSPDWSVAGQERDGRSYDSQRLLYFAPLR